MSEEQWSDVDRYITDLLLEPDEALTAALEASEAGGLPKISVTPNQGKLLMLLSQMQKAERTLEIGTLGGYSTIWLARGLVPGGKLITLEVNPDYAAVARSNIARARLAENVEIMIGAGLESLRKLKGENCPAFDLIFIDADKASYDVYFELALSLSRTGTLIIADNVIRKGTVIDAVTEDMNVCGVRRFYELMAAEPKVSATAIQTVGSKGYDGFAFALVTG